MIMAFNHYAKIRLILDDQPNSWYIRRIDKSTSAKNFKGQTVNFDHFYRIYDTQNQLIKYCKFQQIYLLAKILNKPVEELLVVD